ncbi:MAG: ribbon-helix-helix domain-containing protein [Bdellovibrionales bacterium]
MNTPKRISKKINAGTHQLLLRLEPCLWNDLEEIARREALSEDDLWTRIWQAKPPKTSIAQAARVFIVDYFRHEYIKRCGHGGKAKIEPCMSGQLYEPDEPAIIWTTDE